MLLSRYFLPVLKENPAEAQIVSHQLMLRAGLIRKLGSGLYTWMPLGLITLRKVEQIVREEMNRAGAIEVLGDATFRAIGGTVQPTVEYQLPAASLLQALAQGHVTKTDLDRFAKWQPAYEKIPMVDVP